MNEMIRETDIAIIGMSCRFPESERIDDFWRSLLAGKEMIQKVDEKKLEENGVQRELSGRKEYIKMGATVEGIERFDADFFGFTPFEAKVTDPQQRLFLECCWEALEDSGTSPTKYNGRIGVFGSTSMSTYLLNNIMGNLDFNKEGINYPVLIGNDKDFLSTRVAYKLNLNGPAVTIQSACSSSLVALHYGCQSVLTGECQIALVGGVSLSVPQEVGYLYKEGGILSRDGHCRPFDANASGTVKGNGCGVIAIKSLEQALKDKDPIYSIIKSTAVNNDGSNKIGFTAPSVNGQMEAIKEALYLADIRGEDVGYIETHGTGTPLGDPIEIQALAKAYGEISGKTCAIGSLKANLGHLDAAAGIAGVIKTALLLKNQMITPQVNFYKENSHLQLEKTPFFIADQLIEKEVDYAGVSSFGIGGTNAHVILQKPINLGRSQEEKAPHLFLLSAKKTSSLQKMKENLKEKLVKHHPVLRDVAATLTMGRDEFDHRFVITADNHEQLIEKLSSADIHVSKGMNGNTAFELGYNQSLFSDLYQYNPVYKKTVLSLLSLFQKYEPSINSESFVMESEEELLKHFVYNYTIVSYLSELGLDPKLLVSHNRVEDLVLLSIMKQISLEDAVKMVLLLPVTIRIDKEKQSNFKPLLLLSNGEFFSDSSVLDFGFTTNQLSVIDQEIDFKVPDSYDLVCFTSMTVNTLDLDLSVSKYERLLLIIGEFWSKGGKVNWSLLYQNQSRVHLPTYPFDKEYYWIEPNRNLVKSASIIEERQEINMEDTVINTYKKYLEIETIQLDDDFYDLGGDSLSAVEIVSDIRDQLQVKISLDDFMLLETPRDVISYIKKNKVPPFLKKIHEGLNQKRNIFLIHPAGGNNICYYQLVRNINQSDKNIYVLSYPQDQFTDENMKQVAAYYLQAIKKVQPSGKYQLGGYSFGGNVAFEMALQLQEEGQEIEELILFDSHVPEAYYGETLEHDYFVKAFPLVLGMFLNSSDQSSQLIGQSKSLTIEEVIQQIIASSDLNVKEEEYETFFKIWKHNHNLLKSYYPREKLKGNIILFEAGELESDEVLQLLKIKRVQKDNWLHHLEGNMQVHRVKGNHYSMFSDPVFVKELAAQFEEYCLVEQQKATL
jgi:phthiocerol/phenolphthiocerol synthesis type-I polyketide synthase E